MKKLVALIMCLCMLLTATAFAEGAVLVQDEMPPFLVKTELEDGNVLVAKIYDANGAELSDVLDDGSLVLTDVHFRAEAEEAISVRLTGAYEGVMYDVHYSDVPSLLHDDVVKLDMNEALKNSALDLTAHDLKMYELFDAMMYGDAAAQLTDGAYLEMTLEMAENQPLPLMILFTPDGVEWRVFEEWNVSGDNTLDVRLTEPGTLAFLTAGLPGEEVIGNEEEIAGETEGEENIEYAPPPHFTPSVGAKNQPQILVFEGEDGTSYVATIYVKPDTVVDKIPDHDYLLITPVAIRDREEDIQTHEHLEWAYDLILNCVNVGELPVKEGELPLAEQIDAMLQAANAELTHEQLIVRELFEATVYGEYVDYFYEDEHFIEITFDTDVDPDEPLIVLCSHDSVTWYPLPAEDVMIAANGNVTLHIEELGTFAFLVDGGDILDAEEPVSSPN